MSTFRVASAALASFLAALILGPVPGRAGDRDPPAAGPRSPIEHVIVVVGENHTFDNLFGVYRPRHGARVRNLLSQKDRPR